MIFCCNAPADSCFIFDIDINLLKVFVQHSFHQFCWKLLMLWQFNFSFEWLELKLSHSTCHTLLTRVWVSNYMAPLTVLLGVMPECVMSTHGIVCNQLMKHNAGRLGCCEDFNICIQWAGTEVMWFCNVVHSTAPRYPNSSVSTNVANITPKTLADGIPKFIAPSKN